MIYKSTQIMIKRQVLM